MDFSVFRIMRERELCDCDIIIIIIIIIIIAAAAALDGVGW